MKVIRPISAITVTLTLLVLLEVPSLWAQEPLKSLIASARGQGTLTVGKEVFKVNTVVVNLKEDGTGEITVVTDLQLVFQCNWSAPADRSAGIDLKITGGTTASGAQGAGKLLLRPDGKSIASLNVEGMSNTARRKIQLKFVAN